MSDHFMSNTTCPWFPCHDGVAAEDFNCLFCYCPLYPYMHCGGKYVMLSNGWKDCSDCVFPHKKDNAGELIERLVERYAGQRP